MLLKIYNLFFEQRKHKIFSYVMKVYEDLLIYILGVLFIFQLFVYNPTQLLSYSFKSRSFIVPDTYTKIQITPFVKKMNKNLMWRSLEIRKCYLHNERKLTIFKLYSESNCNFECTLNNTIAICGCIPIQAACKYFVFISIFIIRILNKNVKQ